MSTSSKPVHILVVGAGAVGCFYGSRLHHPDKNIFVSLVCRSNYSAIRSTGVKIETKQLGNYTFHPHAVYSSNTSASTSQIAPPEGWDYILLTTKALPGIVDDPGEIAPLVNKAPAGRTCIVLIQNGIGIESPHRARFPQNPIISVVTTISAEQTSPGVIRHNRWTRAHMGLYSTGPTGQTPFPPSEARRGKDLLDQLVHIMRDLGGIKDASAHTESELLEVRWHKICINAAFNPSSILCGGLGNAAMIRDVEMLTHIKGCMHEVFDAAPAVVGRPLGEHLAKPEIIIKSTAKNAGAKPSMLLDWERGRPMELEAILGNPIRLAREKGVEMPRLQTLYALLSSAQRVREEQKKGGEAKL
ncbi:2-dehydropantoate 2-reductase [Aulographum hederae CBS 113979]|uniref:2-dehydropantoate 2-reductase n=1 Tax=Aulographum hederae CBS 113979 TaxID=1176131 RepID=A0A6G1GLM6_9PEZI|nr:2-dehydropantoate 2-reductase [Aulographum hederae CBS 113979]